MDKWYPVLFICFSIFAVIKAAILKSEYVELLEKIAVLDNGEEKDILIKKKDSVHKTGIMLSSIYFVVMIILISVFS